MTLFVPSHHLDMIKGFNENQRLLFDACNNIIEQAPTPSEFLEMSDFTDIRCDILEQWRETGLLTDYLFCGLQIAVSRPNNEVGLTFNYLGDGAVKKMWLYYTNDLGDTVSNQHYHVAGLKMS